MHGYANIPSTVLDDSLPPQRSNAAYELEERIKDGLAASGLQEVITYRLTTPEAEAVLLGEDESRAYATLTNPSTQERSSLRHSVLASVLEIAAANARFSDRLALFELGHQYLPKGGEKLPSEITINVGDGQIALDRPNDTKQAKAYHGLTRALIQNMVTGVTEGFVKELEIQGVGYRADAKGKSLNLLLGLSHPVEIPVPEGLSVSVNENIIKVEGANRHDVGQFAANIRELRPPEPYKGKGIRYVGEHVRRKVGKAAVG